MSTVLLERATTTLRVLWVEDFFENLTGPLAALEYAGHHVQTALTYESGSVLLASVVFDALIIDQQLLKDGRPTDEAGSELVARLKANEFGELNREIPFVFVTGSRDWVLNADIDVTRLPGFLDIEEKGDQLSGCLSRHLRPLPRRGSDEETGAREAAHPPPSGVGRHAPRFTVLEEWLGVVTSVAEATFDARLEDITRAQEDHYATFLIDAVSPLKRALVVEDGQFLWRLGWRDDGLDDRQMVSQLQFEAIEPPTDLEVDQATARARKMRD